jgi:Domain of unknown function (DUF4190)
MKRCPKCGQTYTDSDINFCLNDGELLSRLTEPAYRSPFDDLPQTRQADDSPPTVVLDQSRVTNPTGWTPPASPPMQYQAPQGQIFSSYPMNPAPSQMLPILSLVFGLCSIFVGLCCYSGILLGPAAIIMGIVGLIQNKNNPELYGGRGFAIAGIATGAAFFVVLFIYLLVVIGVSIS